MGEMTLDVRTNKPMMRDSGLLQGEIIPAAGSHSGAEAQYVLVLGLGLKVGQGFWDHHELMTTTLLS